jgi:Transposase
MVVGIDVHKQTHTAALLDQRGTLMETLALANSAEGAKRLLAWLE